MRKLIIGELLASVALVPAIAQQSRAPAPSAPAQRMETTPPAQRAPMATTANGEPQSFWASMFTTQPMRRSAILTKS